MSSPTGARAGRLFALAAVLAIPAIAVPIFAATPLQGMRCSADVTVVLGASTVDDGDVASDDLAGGVTLVPLGPFPPEVDLDGYHVFPGGDQLLSFDTTVALPGGITARPGDIVRFDGASYTIAFDAAASGLPPDVDVDAVGISDDGDLLLSFDVTVGLSGITLDDEDVARFDGVEFTSFFDGASAGVDPQLDLDALDVLCNGHLLVSFDATGVVGGVGFDDEDLLEYDPGAGTWEMAFDGSAEHPGWVSADLDAVHVQVAESLPAEVHGLRANKVPMATRITWDSQAGTVGPCTRHDVVSGTLLALRADQGFAGASCLVNDLDATSYDDARPDPASGQGVYYLARTQNGIGTGTYGNSSVVPDPRDALDSAGPCP